ncbi:MAG: helix-turn-helix transcriptional regulator [Thermodesulfovibrionales bacterium]|nr:helix-turn-helix transcriptional regulator [Thermodesulfovibrionales bacterium]
MDSTQKKFGENLKKIRNKQKLSREKLAELSGLHWTYIGSVERGARNISLKNIKKLADALNIKICDLFVGINAKKNK